MICYVLLLEPKWRRIVSEIFFEASNELLHPIMSSREYLLFLFKKKKNFTLILQQSFLVPTAGLDMHNSRARYHRDQRGAAYD